MVAHTLARAACSWTSRRIFYSYPFCIKQHPLKKKYLFISVIGVSIQRFLTTSPKKKAFNYTYNQLLIIRNFSSSQPILFY